MPRADVAHGRLALGALLGDRRIRIYNDGRIEGAVAVADEKAAGSETLSGALAARSPSGGGGALRPRLQIRIELPVQGQAAA
ncbi:MAG: hypothetical protein E6J87_04455 [Deltaproteobacteria bacterium]|nr:MAG: hypothetical protein E6J87_04455 [Deltaproteobacteria bacterium]